MLSNEECVDWHMMNCAPGKNGEARVDHSQDLREEDDKKK